MSPPPGHMSVGVDRKPVFRPLEQVEKQRSDHTIYTLYVADKAPRERVGWSKKVTAVPSLPKKYAGNPLGQENERGIRGCPSTCPKPVHPDSVRLSRTRPSSPRSGARGAARANSPPVPVRPTPCRGRCR